MMGIATSQITYLYQKCCQWMLVSEATSNSSLAFLLNLVHGYFESYVLMNDESRVTFTELGFGHTSLN